MASNSASERRKKHGGAKRGKLTAPHMAMPARTDAGHRIRSWGPKFPSIPPLSAPTDQRTGEKQQQQQLRCEAPERRQTPPRTEHCVPNPVVARNTPRVSISRLPQSFGNWQRLGKTEAVDLRGLVPGILDMMGWGLRRSSSPTPTPLASCYRAPLSFVRFFVVWPRSSVEPCSPPGILKAGGAACARGRDVSADRLDSALVIGTATTPRDGTVASRLHRAPQTPQLVGLVAYCGGGLRR